MGYDACTKWSVIDVLCTVELAHSLRHVTADTSPPIHIPLSLSQHLYTQIHMTLISQET